VKNVTRAVNRKKTVKKQTVSGVGLKRATATAEAAVAPAQVNDAECKAFEGAPTAPSEAAVAEDRTKEVIVKELTVPAEPKGATAPAKEMKRAVVDTRSRQEFEALNLGDALKKLQIEQRMMRLNADDLRFERDRYKASAAAFQEKLSIALDENARLRDVRSLLGVLAHHRAAAASSHQAVAAEMERLSAIKDVSERRAEEVRHAHATAQGALHAAEGQLRLAMNENERLASELAETRAEIENMRLSFADMLRKLIADVRAASRQSDAD